MPSRPARHPALLLHAQCRIPPSQVRVPTAPPVVPCAAVRPAPMGAAHPIYPLRRSSPPICPSGPRAATSATAARRSPAPHRSSRPRVTAPPQPLVEVRRPSAHHGPARLLCRSRSPEPGAALLAGGRRRIARHSPKRWSSPPLCSHGSSLLQFSGERVGGGRG
ncbi:unnamed protein product [Urochloa humidicola]